jgi:hypothetical protein
VARTVSLRARLDHLTRALEPRHGHLTDAGRADLLDRLRVAAQSDPEARARLERVEALLAVARARRARGEG